MAERGTRVVCVVDDDESLRRSVRNLLSSVGFRVETFASAEEFLESAHRTDTGCLVLDLRMAGMNGLDLLRHLAATGSRIPVIILTAHGDEEARPGNPSRPARSRSSESRSAPMPCSTRSGRPWAREFAIKREQRHGLWQATAGGLLVPSALVVIVASARPDYFFTVDPIRQLVWSARPVAAVPPRL